jgi:hypothetical protein
MDYPPGWTCELTVRQLELHLQLTLPHRDALAVAEHLEACLECAHCLVLLRLTVAGSAGARGTRG